MTTEAAETLEQLQARHRKEQRDLQARITQKKKAANKKTRKGVNDECESLQTQLQEKQKRELAELNSDGVKPEPQKEQETADETEPAEDASPAEQKTSDLSEAMKQTSISSPAPSEDGLPRSKRNRQKERLARRAAELEAAAIEAEKEAEKLPNWKRLERTSMLKAFKENGLVEREIRPDGHCLFSAVADQLSHNGIPLKADSEAEMRDGQRYRAVRKAAARYIEGHPDDFAAFMDEPLGQYVAKIRDTAEWGGQLELLALAQTYRIEICVIQDGSIERIQPQPDDGKEKEKIWLAYYRHGYGLGEHYNSLRKSP